MSSPAGLRRAIATSVVAGVACLASGCGFASAGGAAEAAADMGCAQPGGLAIVGDARVAEQRAREEALVRAAVEVDRRERNWDMNDDRAICVEFQNVRRGEVAPADLQPASAAAEFDPLMLVGLTAAALLIGGVSFLAFREPRR